jgi:hypothetical protein
MPIRPLKLKDRDFGDEWNTSIEHRWDFEDFRRDARWRCDWISFDGVVYHPDTDYVYCGITSFDADIFQAYDRQRGEFVDLGFSDVADPFDAKFHRSMQLTSDGGTLYAATALLHDVDRYFEAPGGGLYAHDTRSGTTRKLGIPIPHVYIQSIALDEQRGWIYSMHFTPERLSRFDLETNTSRDLGPLGSGMAMAQGENVLLDDDRCAWCGWGLTRAWQNANGPDAFRLCKYDPREDRIIYYTSGLPRRDGSYGFAHVEGLFNLGTGCLYASGDNGSLYRIDTDTAEARYLGTPIADRPSRLTNLVMHSNGYAYGITGRAGMCQLLRFNPRDDSWELGQSIVTEDGTAMYQCHDVTITPDGILYAGENDNPQRSGYLWEIPLAEPS